MMMSDGAGALWKRAARRSFGSVSVCLKKQVRATLLLLRLTCEIVARFLVDE